MIFEWHGTKLVARSYKDSTDVLQATCVVEDDCQLTMSNKNKLKRRKEYRNESLGF